MPARSPAPEWRRVLHAVTTADEGVIPILYDQGERKHEVRRMIYAAARTIGRTASTRYVHGTNHIQSYFEFKLLPAPAPTPTPTPTPQEETDVAYYTRIVTRLRKLIRVPSNEGKFLDEPRYYLPHSLRDEIFNALERLARLETQAAAAWQAADSTNADDSGGEDAEWFVFFDGNSTPALGSRFEAHISRAPTALIAAEQVHNGYFGADDRAHHRYYVVRDRDVAVFGAIHIVRTNFVQEKADHEVATNG